MLNVRPHGLIHSSAVALLLRVYIHRSVESTVAADGVSSTFKCCGRDLHEAEAQNQPKANSRGREEKEDGVRIIS